MRKYVPSKAADACDMPVSSFYAKAVQFEKATLI